MDKKIIKGLIDEKLEVIQEQFSIIRAYEGKIPYIELDLILNSIRDLYELMLSLQIENMSGIKSGLMAQAEPGEPEIFVKEPVAARQVEIPVQPAPKPEPEPEPEPEPAPEIMAKPEPVAPPRISPVFLSMEPVREPEETLPETKPVPEPEPEPEPEPFAESESTVRPDPATEASSQPYEPADKPQKITFDLFSDSIGSTLADRLREGQDKRLADKLQENRIVDLRTTIGINDKFLFINELFDGNMRIYDEVIQKLNSTTTTAQADMLMLDLKIAYNWDSESPTVKKFVELVRRKF